MWRHPGFADVPGMPPSGWPNRTSSRRREDGQTMAEYVVVLAVITPIVVLAFMTLGDAVIPTVNAVRDFLTGAS
jgi:Flp pilus assembly pilin Flp